MLAKRCKFTTTSGRLRAQVLGQLKQPRVFEPTRPVPNVHLVQKGMVLKQACRNIADYDREPVVWKGAVPRLQYGRGQDRIAQKGGLKQHHPGFVVQDVAFSPRHHTATAWVRKGVVQRCLCGLCSPCGGPQSRHMAPRILPLGKALLPRSGDHHSARGEPLPCTPPVRVPVTSRMGVLAVSTTPCSQARLPGRTLHPFDHNRPGPDERPVLDDDRRRLQRAPARRRCPHPPLRWTSAPIWAHDPTVAQVSTMVPPADIGADVDIARHHDDPPAQKSDP